MDTFNEKLRAAQTTHQVNGVYCSSHTEIPVDNFYSKLVFKVFRFVLKFFHFFLKILLSIGIIPMIYLMGIFKVNGFITFLAFVMYLFCLFYDFAWILITALTFMATVYLYIVMKFRMVKFEDINYG